MSDAHVQHDPGFDPRTITRPAPVLLSYYVLTAVLTGPAFPITMLALWFRYTTLRYRFDDDGVWMTSGLLFKREVNLAYRRIQDIHVTRGVLQRYFKLATVSVQTASGSATPEMSIEGVLEAEQLRDFLYAKMRGARGDAAPAPTPVQPATASPGATSGSGSHADEALAILRDIRDTLRTQQGASGGGVS